MHAAIAIAALLLATAGAAHSAGRGAEPGLVVDGTCRGGLANGIYELRGPDGMLRALGAFHTGKRTGTFIFWNAHGGRLAAIPYDEDVRNGTIALWHIGAGSAREIGRRLEAPVQRGRPEGTVRSWHRNGRRSTEAEYVDGRVVRVLAWGASGRPLADAEAARVEQKTMEAADRELADLERLVAEHRPACRPDPGGTRPSPERSRARAARMKLSLAARVP